MQGYPISHSGMRNPVPTSFVAPVVLVFAVALESETHILNHAAEDEFG